MSGSSLPGPSVTLRRLAFAGWFFCSVFFLYAFILRVAPAVMVEETMRDFSVGAAILGNLSAVYFYAYAGLQIPVGVMIDRWGPRVLIAGAAGLAGGGAILFSAATDVWTAYAGRVLIGAGCAFSFAGALNMAAMWFPARFASLGGWAQMMGVAGGILGQAPLRWGVETVGWRESMLLVGIAGLVLGLLLWLTVRDHPDRTGSETSESIRKGLMTVMRTPQVWLAAFVGGSMTGAMLSYAGLWGVPFLVEIRGIDKISAAEFTSLMFVGWAVGAPLSGWLSDRAGRRMIFLVVGTAISTVFATAVVLFADMPTPALVTCLLLQGAGSSSMVLCFAVARAHTPAGASGATIGFVNMFVVGSGAVLQPLIGWLLDLQWDGAMDAGARIYSVDAYIWALLVLPVFCGAGFLGTLILREQPKPPNP